MEKDKILVVGLGEVGTAMFNLVKESGKFEAYGLDLDKTKMKDLKQKALPGTTNVMHICLPCKDQAKFVDIVTSYARRFKPKLVIINSTVPLVQR